MPRWLKILVRMLLAIVLGGAVTFWLSVVFSVVGEGIFGATVTEDEMFWGVVGCFLLLAVVVFLLSDGNREPTRLLGRRTGGRLRRIQGRSLPTSALDSRPKF